MKPFKVAVSGLGIICLWAWSATVVSEPAKATSSTVQVHMVITDQALSDNSEAPPLRPEILQVKQGKNALRVEQLIPAQGDNDALQLFILIDDTCDAGIGNNLNDIRDFIDAQPKSTAIGVAYMSNATIQIAQNFTDDHALAAKAVRLPRGSLSSMDSPYLSLISLIKGWPQQKVRREVLMVSDGIDRLRSQRSSLPSMSPDADTASTNSQRYGVIVHSIYATGAGRIGRNAWQAQLGQSGLAKIADETGGESFALGTQNAVSFKPYLQRLQKILNSQYYLVFRAIPEKKDGLQRINISTQAANTDVAAADNVWVPVGK